MERPGCAVVSAPVTGSISGTTLTVTAIDPGGAPPSVAPFIGAYTSIDDFGGSNPTAGTYVVQQLTSTESGGALGGRGTYQVSVSQTNSGNYTMRPGGMYLLSSVSYPYWAGIAATYGKRVCHYEGGFECFPNLSNVPTSYLGNPLNIQDSLNLCAAYQNSSQWAATLLASLNAFKASGGTYFSQYQLTGTANNTGNMFQMIYPTIFGPAPLQKTTALDVYNAS
jgi:hypothetical protein